MHNILFQLLCSSTCFGHPCAHPQEDLCIFTTSGSLLVSVGDRTVGRLVSALSWNLKLIITKMHGQQHIKYIYIHIRPHLNKLITNLVQPPNISNEQQAKVLSTHHFMMNYIESHTDKPHIKFKLTKLPT
jgi:hypothetical protein